MVAVGSRVRVLRGRHFLTFKEREEGDVLAVNVECRNCHVRFDNRPEPVLVAWKHLRVVEAARFGTTGPADGKDGQHASPPKSTVAQVDLEASVGWTPITNAAHLESENKRLAKIAEQCEAVAEDLRAKFMQGQREGCQLRDELSWTRGEELSAELALARGEEIEAYARRESANLEALAAQRQSEVSKLTDIATNAKNQEAALFHELRLCEQELLASVAERQALQEQYVNISAELALEKEGQDRRVCAELKSELASLQTQPVLLQGSNVDELLARIAELEAMNFRLQRAQRLFTKSREAAGCWLFQ
eukprot:gnl/MRDRNA2_/MRDRNA2_82387_c0_seq2.p1 gnl/MRDRNA2_/MRDRNA2_82387_c0~~gnl/MRDRNA2_/MRDRNA2_82387_c0_seq2.p1  ORF type:complete len:306 (+),score=80.39 gnl/MRDRNA2_/MRDRNA2_82387_c0_seq2:153-1070(+)